MDVFNILKIENFIFDIFWKLPKLPRDKKDNQSSITLFLQLQIEFIFSLNSSTLFHFILKNLKIINVFDDVRAYPNF